MTSDSVTRDSQLADQSGHPLRLLFVHAHPDDETTTTGATAARYAAEGVGVYLVTCTRGERGEILDDELLAKFAGLDPDSAAVRLAEHRTGELAGACARLGFTQWRFLAGPQRWWDSGMDGTPTATHAKAFSAGDTTDQAAELAAVMRSLRPQVVITYDERGGYGHPDHIRAHDITMAAVRLAADGTDDDKGWRVSKVYACAVPRSQIELGAAMLASSDAEGPNPLADLVNAPFAVPDELICARVDGNAWLDAKADAMRAHHSQMHVNGWFFKLLDFGAFGLEHYRLLAGTAAPPAGEPWEDDLFAGLRGEPRPASDRTLTLEAYADTIIPGEKRWPGDRAVAGIADGGGSVAAGALTVLQMPEGGMAPMLDDVVAALNAHAERYRADHGLAGDDSVPPMVALPAEHRVALIKELTAPGHPEKELWTGLGLFCYMAFDSAVHLHTADALAQGHPGLTAMGFASPGKSGLWRFPDYGYRRPLARPHPRTTASGSPE